MSSPADARAKAVLAALERAAAAAAMPIALHRHTDGAEHLAASGSAPRAACRWVQDRPEGEAACAMARSKAARAALRRGKPVPFVCPLGFACVSVPVPGDGEGGQVATAGPFLPAEAPQGAETGVTLGLKRLGLIDGGPLPFELDDIAVTPVPAAHACADWLVDTLAALHRSDAEEQEAAAQPGEGRRGAARRGPDAVTRTGPEASLCAGAVAGDWAGLRKTLGVLLQTGADTPPTAVHRARALKTAAAVLEAAESSRTPGTAHCWERLDALAESVAAARSGQELVNAVVAFLKPLKARASGTGRDSMLAVVHAAVCRDVAACVSLEDVARELGVHPTAVTHRLQRTLGLSFTEYVGQLRVEKAKELLRRTRLGIGEVGRRVGIDDQSNFSKLFRRHAGMSPGDYRAKTGRKA